MMGFGPQGWGLALQAGVMALRLGFGPKGRNLIFKDEIWAQRSGARNLGFKPGIWDWSQEFGIQARNLGLEADLGFKAGIWAWRLGL